MDTLYKLTTQDNKTRVGQPNETVWGPGVTHAACGEGGLCTDGVIHAYRSPLIAVLLNMAHAAINNPKLWLAEGDVVEERADKCGVKELTTIKEIPLPKVSMKQRMRFAQQTVRLMKKQQSNSFAASAIAAAKASITDASSFPVEAHIFASHAAATAADFLAYTNRISGGAGANRQSSRAFQEIAEWAVTDLPESAVDHLMQ